MRLLQIAARPMLGSLFISSGIDTLRSPEPRADLAQGTLEQLRGFLPFLPEDDLLLVRANAAAQLVCGTTLSVGKFPRLSALVLAASLVPTTYAGHAWWQHEEAEARSGHRTQFGKNAAVLGGLVAVIGTPRAHRRHGAHGCAAHCPSHRAGAHAPSPTAHPSGHGRRSGDGKRLPGRKGSAVKGSAVKGAGDGLRGRLCRRRAARQEAGS